MVKCGNPHCGKPIRVTRDKHYFIKELKQRYHIKCLLGSCRECGKPVFPQDAHETLPSGGVWHQKCFDAKKKGDVMTITDSSYKKMQTARKAADIPKKLWRDFEERFFKKHKPEFEEDAAVMNPELAFIAIDETLSGKNKNWIEGEIDSGKTPRNFPWHEVGVRGLRDHIGSLKHTLASQKAKDAVLYIISAFDWSLEEFENALAVAKENENWLYIVPIFIMEHEKAEENARYFAKRMSPRRMTESVELFLQATDVRSNPEVSTVYDDDRYMAILRGMPESGNGFKSPEKMFEEERAEHPSLTDEQVWQLVQDHLKETFRGNPLSSEEEAVMPTKDDFPIGVTGIDDFLKWWSYGLTLGLIRWDGKVVEPITAKKFINWWTSGFTLGFLKVEDPLTIDALDNVGDFLARALSLGLLTWKKGRTSRLTVNPDQLKSIEAMINSAYQDLQEAIGFDEVLNMLGRATEMLKRSPVDAFRQLEEAASEMSEQIGYEDVHRKISEASERLDRLIRTRNNPPQLKLKKMKSEEAENGAKHIRKRLDEIHERMEKVSGKKPVKKNPRRPTKEFWCLSEDTRILTDDGLKSINEVGYDTTLITFDMSTGELREEKPIEIGIWNYNGEMILAEGQRYSLLTTPNHEHVVRWQSGTKKNKHWFKMSAERVMARNGSPHSLEMPRTGIWNCSEPKSIAIGNHKEYFQQTKSYEEMPTEPFMRFLGWYLSEGYVYINGKHHAIAMTQNIGPLAERIERIMNEAGIRWGKTAIPLKAMSGHWGKRDMIRYNICSKMLYDYLIEFGKGAENKRILPYIKKMPADLLDKFLTEYILGDGFAPKRLIYTRSSKMADDLTEIGIKAGYGIHKTTADYGVRKPIHRVHLVKAKCTCFTDKPKTIPYKGKVWGIETPSGTIIVERKGNLIVTGNSKHYPDVLKSTKKAHPRWPKERIEKAARGTTAQMWKDMGPEKKAGYEKVRRARENPVRPQAEVEEGYKGMKKEFGLDQVEFLVIDKYERLIEKGTSTREGALTYARNAAMEAGLAPEDVRVVFPDDEPPEVRERLRSFVREMR